MNKIKNLIIIVLALLIGSPVLAAVFTTSQGGTGTSTAQANFLLIGKPDGTGWTQIATSSLGITGGGGGNPSVGTQGAIQFASSTAGAFNASSNSLFWDNTNGRLGIGTSTPGSRLSVVGGNIDIDGSRFYSINGVSVVSASTSLSNFFYGGGRASATGAFNTGVGSQSLASLTSGSSNVAMGLAALSANTTGSNNVAIGVGAMQSNITSGANTVVGVNALYYATSSANNNNAFGNSALLYLASGSLNNTAIGTSAGIGSSTIGATLVNGNTFLGNNTGLSVVTGADNNTFLGYRAGQTVTSGARNINIGFNIQSASTTGNDQLNIGNTLYGNLATGNIGIGTSSPDKQITVASTTATSTKVGLDSNGLFFSRTIDNGYNASIGRDNLVSGPNTVALAYSANTQNFYKNDASTLMASIGITSATVTGNGGILSIPTISNITNINGLSNSPLTILSDDASSGQNGMIFGRTSRVATGTAAIATFQYNAGEVMRVSTNGNVGIGTSSPANKLDVYGAILTAGGSGGNIILGNATGANRGHLTNLGTVIDLGVPTGVSNPLTFTTNGIERARIVSTGLFGIGTTTPNALLTVQGTSGSSTDLFTVASSTKSYVSVKSMGGIVASGDLPAVSSCGVSPTISSDSNQIAGAVTVGTGGVTSCTVTFATPYPAGTTVHVFLNQDTGSLVTSAAQSVTTSGFVISSLASLGGDVISYHVIATQ